MFVIAEKVSTSLNITCEGKLKKEALNFRRRYPVSGVPNDQCACVASVKINNKYYCKKHGGVIALELLINETIKSS